MDHYSFAVFPDEDLLDLWPFQYGWEQCEPAHSYGPATRNHYLFHYIIKGKGVLHHTDDHGQTHIYNLKPHQGFLICPELVSTYIADKEDPWEYAWAEFDGLRVKEFLETAGLTERSPIYRSSNRELRGGMKEELLNIVHGKEHSSLYQIGHLYLFLDAMTNSVSSIKLKKAGRLRDFYVREALTFMEQNFHNDISVEDIADNCGLNRSYFGKIFKKTVGMTPLQYRNYQNRK